MGVEGKLSNSWMPSDAFRSRAPRTDVAPWTMIPRQAAFDVVSRSGRNVAGFSRVPVTVKAPASRVTSRVAPLSSVANSTVAPASTVSAENVTLSVRR